MKRAPKLTKRERRGVASAVAPCTRPLRAQLVPQAPVRVGDHPREHVRRVDLLTDDELDQFRVAHGEQAEAALDLVGELETLVEERLTSAGLAADLGKLTVRPTLSVFACLACGASDIGTDTRSGVVARAIDRTRLAERDLRRVEALLEEAWAPDPVPSLDQLPPQALLELVALTKADVDLVTLRERVGGLVESPPGRWR